MRNSHNKIANRFAIRKLKTGVACVAIASIFATGMGTMTQVNAAEVDTSVEPNEEIVAEDSTADESVEVVEPVEVIEVSETVEAEVVEDTVVEPTEEPVIEETIVEDAPAVEEPVVVAEENIVEQEPVTEEVIVQEPVVQDVIVEQEPVIEPVVEQENVEETPVAEEITEPVVETPVVETIEEPVVQEPIVEVTPEVIEPTVEQDTDIAEDVTEPVVEPVEDIEDAQVEVEPVVEPETQSVEVNAVETNETEVAPLAEVTEEESTQIPDLDDNEDRQDVITEEELEQEVEVPALPEENETESEDAEVVEEDEESVEQEEPIVEETPDETVTQEEVVEDDYVSESETVKGIKEGDVWDYPVVDAPEVPGYESKVENKDDFIINQDTIDYYKELIDYDALKAAQDEYNQRLSEARLDRGLGAVQSKDHVTDFAFMKAVDMVMNGYYYTSKDGTGQLDYQEKFYFNDAETRPFDDEFTRHSISIARTTRDFAGDYSAALNWMFNASYVEGSGVQSRMNQERITHTGVGLFRDAEGYTYVAQIMYADGERNPNELTQEDGAEYTKVNPEVVRDYIAPEIVDNTVDWQTIQLDKINAERAALGYAPLTLSTHLSEFAYMKSLDMDLNNYYAHSKDGVGGQTKQYYYFFEDLALDLPRGIGENIQTGFDADGNIYAIEETAYSAFKRSPGHFGNMTNENYTHVGLGLYQPGPGQDYKFVQVFYNDIEGFLQAFDETGERVPEEDVIVPVDPTPVPTPETPDEEDTDEPVAPTPDEDNTPETETPETPSEPEEEAPIVEDNENVDTPAEPNTPVEEDDTIVTPTPDVDEPITEDEQEETPVDESIEDEPVTEDNNNNVIEEDTNDTVSEDDNEETPVIEEENNNDNVILPETDNADNADENDDMLVPVEEDDVTPGADDNTVTPEPESDETTPVEENVDAPVATEADDTVIESESNETVRTPELNAINQIAEDAAIAEIEAVVNPTTGYGSGNVDMSEDIAVVHAPIEPISAPVVETADAESHDVVDVAQADISEDANPVAVEQESLPNTGTAINMTNIAVGGLLAMLGAVGIAATRRKKQSDQ